MAQTTTAPAPWRATSAPAGAVAGLRDLVGRRSVLLALIRRQMWLRRKRAVFGLLWPLTAPLFLLALYSFIFDRVFDVPVRDYPVYLFAGLLPWTFMVQAVHQSLQSITAEADLIRRAPFPHEHLPLSIVGIHLLPFGALLTGFVAYVAVKGDLRWDLVPVLALPVVALVMLTSAMAMILSLIDVYNRDLRQILHNVFTVWFFLVPIVYRPDMVEGPLRSLRSIDPMNMIVGQFRYVLYHGHVFRPTHVVLMMLVASATFVVSLGIFRRASRNLAKEL